MSEDKAWNLWTGNTHIMVSAAGVCVGVRVGQQGNLPRASSALAVHQEPSQTTDTFCGLSTFTRRTAGEAQWLIWFSLQNNCVHVCCHIFQGCAKTPWTHLSLPDTLRNRLFRDHGTWPCNEGGINESPRRRGRQTLEEETTRESRVLKQNKKNHFLGISSVYLMLWSEALQLCPDVL